MPRSNWEPVDWILVGLEVIVILILCGIVFMPRDPAAEEIEAMKAIIAGILAVIATYVGSQIEKRRHDHAEGKQSDARKRNEVDAEQEGD